MNVQATSEQGVGTEQLIQVLPADTVVRAAATTARDALGSLLNASPAVLDEALLTMAELLRADIRQVRMANEDDVDQAAAAGMSGALLDRLRLTPARLAAMSEQLVSLASVADPEWPQQASRPAAAWSSKSKGDRSESSGRTSRPART